ncbi:MAG: 60S ribosomal L28 [Lasallia pustulata]|uniref:60S ribosomal L28 n=1 Tax=Lasallia pustulata TaxID=136370 RepID=A0A5M8PDX9_9LECA|nr:MAG: 60S ribosomal L28 [Lasallia pustulata]
MPRQQRLLGEAHIWWRGSVLEGSIESGEQAFEKVCRLCERQGTITVYSLLSPGLPVQAVGIHPAEKGGVTMVTKKTKHHNRPAANKNEVSWTGNKSGPKIYKGIVNYTAKQGYRADLRQEAVARASAIRRSSQPKKEVPEKKLRGSKAKKAAEKDSS